MQSEAITALTLTHWIPKTEGDFIGADRGALVLAKKNIHMKLAIGDFDSVTNEEFQCIQQNADEVIRLNPIKDDSDSEAALNLLIERGYQKIVFLDALGGRADQAYVNLMLAYKHQSVVHLLDEQNDIYALEKGRYVIPKEEYAYISFFTLDKAVITLENMKYPLSKQTITLNDLYTLSNEIKGKEGILTIQEGKVLVMRTRDKNKKDSR